MYINNLNLQIVNRYHTENGKSIKLVEKDKLVLTLHLTEQISTFAKTNFVINIDLLFITDTDNNILVKYLDHLEHNLKLLLLGLNIPDEKIKKFKHKTKVRISPKITKILKGILTGFPKTPITDNKFKQIENEYRNSEISESTYKKYKNRNITNVYYLLGRIDGLRYNAIENMEKIRNTIG